MSEEEEYIICNASGQVGISGEQIIEKDGEKYQVMWADLPPGETYPVLVKII